MDLSCSHCEPAAVLLQTHQPAHVRPFATCWNEPGLLLWSWRARLACGIDTDAGRAHSRTGRAAQTAERPGCCRGEREHASEPVRPRRAHRLFRFRECGCAGQKKMRHTGRVPRLVGLVCIAVFGAQHTECWNKGGSGRCLSTRRLGAGHGTGWHSGAAGSSVPVNLV